MPNKNDDLQLLKQISQTGKINRSSSDTNSSNKSKKALRTLTEGTQILHYEESPDQQ